MNKIGEIIKLSREVTSKNLSIDKVSKYFFDQKNVI